MTDLRYCFYCDAYRERLRCEACGWHTHSMREPPLSALPPAWRTPLSTAPGGGGGLDETPSIQQQRKES